MSEQGIPVHGEVVSNDASSGVAVTFYPAGSATARALASDEFFNLTDLLLVSKVGGDYALVVNTAAAGKYLAKGYADALGGMAHHFSTPVCGPVGVTPKLIAAAGQVDLVVSGYITKA